MGDWLPHQSTRGGGDGPDTQIPDTQISTGELQDERFQSGRLIEGVERTGTMRLSWGGWPAGGMTFNGVSPAGVWTMPFCPSSEARSS